MARVIVGIHGLNNKADRNVLKIWWKLALRHGMRAAGYVDIPFQFELIYWADLLYPQPLNALITDEKHPQFLSQPFKNILPTAPQEHNARRQKILDQLEAMLNKALKKESVFNRFNSLAEKLIEKRFHDLHCYLEGESGYGDAVAQPVREVIAERFAEILHRHRGKSICLIAHSMGSIIAYDMFYHHRDLPEIDLLITIGSPLAQPTLMAKLTDVNPVFSKIATPAGIKRWYNLSDLHDLVAFNYNLNDDYRPNTQGVNPIDQIVHNTYEWEGKTNPHHVLGYLQTAECITLVWDFLTVGRSRLFLYGAQLYSRLQERFFQKSAKMLAAAPSRTEAVDGKSQDEVRDDIHTQTRK